MLQVLAQGPGVMKGYFKDEGATAKAFRAGHGWLDTGDLGWQAPGTLTEPQAQGSGGLHSSGNLRLCCRPGEARHGIQKHFAGIQGVAPLWFVCSGFCMGTPGM